MGLEGLEVVWPRVPAAREGDVRTASERVVAAEQAIAGICLQGLKPTKSLKDLKEAVRAEALEGVVERLQVYDEVRRLAKLLLMTSPRLEGVAGTCPECGYVQDGRNRHGPSIRHGKATAADCTIGQLMSAIEAAEALL